MKKMAKKLRSMFVTLGFAALATALVGCGGTTGKRYNEAVIVSVRQNQMYPATERLKAYIREAVDCPEGCYLALYTCDSKPEKVVSDNVKGSSGGSSKEEAIHESYTNSVIEVVEEEMKANDPEADVYSAMCLAYKDIMSQPSGFNRMVINDSMISTAGCVNLAAENLALASMDIEKYVENMTCVDLSALDEVILVNIGIADGCQPGLSVTEQNKLQELWEAIFAKSGVSSDKIKYITDPPSGGVSVSDMDLPMVTPIKTMPEEQVFTAETTEETTAKPDSVSKVDLSEPYVIPDNDIHFKGDSDELVTPEAEVERILRPIAESVVADDVKILVMGGTASAGEKENTKSMIKLSSARAEVVKKRLVTYGCAEENIVTVGAGIQHPFYVNDLDEEGRFLESKGAKNRIVVIMKLDSDTAATLVREYK